MCQIVARHAGREADATLFSSLCGHTVGECGDQAASRSEISLLLPGSDPPESWTRHGMEKNWGLQGF